MNLHSDKNAFRSLIEQINQKTGYRMDVLEKDYYVVLVLKELADKQADGLPAYFKGGTALYKALKTTRRFSEDIDISVDSRNCSRTQNERRLEKATKRYSSLQRVVGQGKTERSTVESVYQYEPIIPYDLNDALQRFGLLKIEATSFTISEPVESMEISPLLYDFATTEQKNILEEIYKVKPFTVQTISLERIFVDKIFAAESYMRKSAEAHRAFEAAKHIYDLVVMISHPKIQQLLSDETKLSSLLQIRMQEELNRLDGIPNICPSEFSFFSEAKNNHAVYSAYEIMQQQYVFRENDKIP